MAQEPAPPAPPQRGAGCAVAFLAGIAGIAVGAVLTVVLWNLVGPEDAEEAPIGLFVVIGAVVVPTCFWISTVGALAWFIRRSPRASGQPARPGGCDVVDRSIATGIAGAASGLLLAVLTWALARDPDEGLALGGLVNLVVVLVLLGTVLGAGLSVAWHRRRSET